MRRIRCVLIAIVLVTSVLPVCMAHAPAQAPTSTPAQGPADSAQADLPRYLELTPRVGTGAQPTNVGFRKLAEKGYKAIVNLRTADEGYDLAAEEKLIQQIGLRYFNVPVAGAEPKADQARIFLKVMEELKDEKVFVHCTAANRVGGLMMIQRVLQEGISIEKAEEEAKQIGLRTDILRKFARDYIENNKKPQ
jgi:protein tyrosine phosphatase (PTP) superfamily phosphohydrolase (DUF442 family)